MEIEERGRFFSSPRADLFLFSFFPSFLAAGFSALLAMLGLFPRRFLNGIGSEVQKPLAVVIIGGLIAATLLTLIVLQRYISSSRMGCRKEAESDSISH